MLSGCSGDNEQASEAAVTEETTSTPKEHFASDLKRSLDQAKSVEQLLQQGVDQRQLEIEAQTAP